jgi:transposase
VANSADKNTFGIDVAKDQLVICHWNTEQTVVLPNRCADILAWLACWSEPVRMALEPTSHYHLSFLEAAVARGHQVYLVNPRQLVHYRQAVNVRNKTDPQDAWLLARFLAHEAAQLRPFRPRDRRAQRLWALLTRRATVIRNRQQLQQSFGDLRISIQALLTQFQHLLLRLDRQIECLIRELGWWSDYQRCLSIPGIGPANAAALVTTYQRGAFANRDAFIAFLGLDVRLRESGRYKGKARLTKRGEPELRRLLYCASHAARQYPRFAAYYQQQREKGLCKIAARITLARKLARIAFTLMQNQQDFIRQA